MCKVSGSVWCAVCCVSYSVVPRDEETDVDYGEPDSDVDVGLEDIEDLSDQVSHLCVPMIILLVIIFSLFDVNQKWQ